MAEHRSWAQSSHEHYGDLHGSIALDTGGPGDAATRLAGLDDDEWLVVGIELHGGHELGAQPMRGSVLAARRAIWEAFPEGISAAASASGGRLPVTRIQLSEEAAAKLLQSFKRWTLRAARRELEGFDVAISGAN